MPSCNNHSLLRILDSNGGVVGAGFVVAERLAVTCAHVVRNAATWNQKVGYLVVCGICDYGDSHKNDRRGSDRVLAV